MHFRNLIERLKLTLIKRVPVALEETFHFDMVALARPLFPAFISTFILLFLIVRLDLLERRDWVQNNIVHCVKLTFLDSQELSHDGCQTVEIVAVNSLLLLE